MNYVSILVRVSENAALRSPNGAVTIRPRAWREINFQIEYLEEHAGLETAERFLENLIRTFQELANMPRQGVRCNFRRSSARRLRRWHGARDIESILG